MSKKTGSFLLLIVKALIDITSLAIEKRRKADRFIGRMSHSWEEV
jgi:hypothetical protein